MKILHLADLHLGRKINDFSLIDDQIFVLNQAIELVLKDKIKIVFISGDIFDRAVPSSEALELFGDFLLNLSNAHIKCYIISGNHDNIERLSYLSDLVKNSNIFISKIFSGSLEKYPLNENIDLYLMPYLYLAQIRKFYPDIKISDYNGAIKALIDDINIDKNKINIILAHQFVISDNIILSDSEQHSVGGIDAVSPNVFEKFDYVALGHLHCPQKVLSDKIRYGGSILKYSFNEVNQKKLFTVLDIDKNGKISFEFHEIEFLHDLKIYKGFIQDFLKEDFYLNINKDDYIQFVLFDDYVTDAKKKLSAIFPNILFLGFDNKFTKAINSPPSAFIGEDKNISEHFFDFYKLQCDEDIDDEKRKILSDILSSQEEGE